MIKKTLLFVIILVHGVLSFSLKDSRIKELQKIVYEKKIAKIEKILKKDNQEEKKYLLFFSVLSRNEGICSYLIENGLDVNQFDEYYNTPLLKACSVNENTEIVDLLLRKGASVKAKNTKFATPLIIASQIPNNIETVRLLLLANSDVNAKDANGETALIKATKADSLEIVQLLIKNNADINIVDNNNNTALFYAIKNNSKEIVKELLAKGATISINGDKGDTLAELAGENDEILKLLKEHGYKPSPTELWNGFTDEMTKNQVIARADKLLNSKGYDCTWELNGRSGSIPRIFSADDRLNDFALPTALFKYRSPNREFENIHGNIEFYFYENKLYAIEIHWNTDIQDAVIQKAIDNYGTDYELKDDFAYYITTPQYNFDAKVYCWNKNGKKVYLNKKKCSFNPNSLVLTVFSKNLIQRYKVDLKEKEAKQRQQAEEERKKNAERIKF